jgi:hypothetical protein
MKLALITQNNGYDFRKNTKKPYFKFEYLRSEKINQLKEIIAQLKQKEPEDYIEEKWSQKYKRSINCANPRGFSQRAHCAGRKK